LALLKEQSLWAIWVYRYGRRIDRCGDGLRKKIEARWYWILFPFMETIIGIIIPKVLLFRPGLRIWHFGWIFLHPHGDQ
jgi:serine O-acetyltransferase